VTIRHFCKYGYDPQVKIKIISTVMDLLSRNVHVNVLAQKAVSSLSGIDK
jgi:hypothetical protein